MELNIKKPLEIDNDLVKNDENNNKAKNWNKSDIGEMDTIYHLNTMRTDDVIGEVDVTKKKKKNLYEGQKIPYHNINQKDTYSEDEIKKYIKLLKKMKDYCNIKRNENLYAYEIYNKKELQIFIPAILTSLISGFIGSIFSLIPKHEYYVGIIFTIIIGLLTISTSFLQSMQQKLKYSIKSCTHEYMAIEYDSLYNRLKNIVEMPITFIKVDINFIREIEDKIIQAIKIKRNLVPLEIERKYDDMTDHDEINELLSNYKFKFLKQELENNPENINKKKLFEYDSINNDRQLENIIIENK